MTIRRGVHTGPLAARVWSASGELLASQDADGAAHSQRIMFDPKAIFLVGDNGSGKSTLAEALAVAAGFNPEGGSQAFRFATRATESSLGDPVILRWGLREPKPAARRCCPPTADAHCTNSHTASRSFRW